MIYVETSAFLSGILVDSIDHYSMAVLLGDPDQVLVSSQLLWLEADRTAIRLAAEHPGFHYLPQEVEAALSGIHQIRLDTSLINAARKIPDVIKSLDAIHVATADMLSDMIEYVVTYDKTMTKTLRLHGLAAGPASQFNESPDTMGGRLP
ncbi:MAG: PIN domain-containing protein [Propionibacteriaceae bacterium]|nr:PIN domain-containing protein [Propionibacteriaceae bacterium]